MQLIVFFEILLLVAIVAGVFVCWDRPAGEERPRTSSWKIGVRAPFK